MTNATSVPTRRFRVGFAFALSLLLALTALGGGSISHAAVDDQASFRATFNAPSANVVEVIQQAQASDYWIRVQTGQDVTYLKGNQTCPSCEPTNEAEFFQRPQLVADGQMVWMRLAGENWELNLRPAPDSDDTYALIVSPLLPETTLSDEMLRQVGEALAPFELLPGDVTSLDFASYTQSSDPQPPQGLNLTPTLYSFQQAPDWAEAAAERDIARSGLRAVVDVELSSDSSELPSELGLIVESRSGSTARVQVLIPQLDDLAHAAGVSMVR